ncbi:hypothetical protein GJ496_001029 [Pomphorhynchus laevis]|nr:hypothetical protein GJ496_001029 [Pomphorhynchus laevis]
MMQMVDQHNYTNKGIRLTSQQLPAAIRDLVPESEMYNQLLDYESRIDGCVQRKQIELEEIVRNAPKIKRKLRILVSSQFYPEGFPNSFNGEDHVLPIGIPAWELHVEGRLVPIEGVLNEKKYKFSSFFKSLIIELDKDLYGPDNHIVEWNRMANTVETDGFQVRRVGDQDVKCQIIMLLQCQASQYRLDARFARLLGFSADQPQQSRNSIIRALWSYIQRNKLQDAEDPDLIRPNQYLGQLLDCAPGQMIRFIDLPVKIQRLLYPSEPIILNHVIQTNPERKLNAGDDQSFTNQSPRKKFHCYVIEVETDDPVKEHARLFIDGSNETVTKDLEQTQLIINNLLEQITEHNLRRKFFKAFADNPQQFIDRWLASQCRDLKHLSDPLNWDDLTDDERKSAFYSEQQPWLHEAIGRYIHGRIQLKKQELDKIIDTNRKIGSG